MLKTTLFTMCTKFNRPVLVLYVIGKGCCKKKTWSRTMHFTQDIKRENMNSESLYISRRIERERSFGRIKDFDLGVPGEKKSL